MSARASASTTSQGQGPYFAHDVLEQKAFSNKFRQPVGGPCPSSRTPLGRDYRDKEELGDERAVEESISELPAAVIAPKPKLLKPKLPSSSGKKEYKRVRVAGGRAPMAKKVTWELDSDDEIIVDMKQQNATDKEVADRLISEGRTRYNHKTISSRWIRLRRVLAQREDELLDEQLTDWHEGEDECLYNAYDMADEEILQELDKVRNKRWEYVTQNLRRLKPTARYSQHACKERYEALEAGTARIPPELDDDPAAPAYQGAEERAAKQRAKAEAAAAKRAAAAAKKEEREFALAVRKAEKEERELQAKADKEEAAARAKADKEEKASRAKAKKEAKALQAKANRKAKAVQAKADKAEKARQAKAQREEKAIQAKAKKQQEKLDAAKETKKALKKAVAKASTQAKQGVKRKAQSAAPIKAQPAKKKLKSTTAPPTASKASGGRPAPQQAQ